MIKDIFEIAMVLLFGVSWPMSILKSYRARTTAGKSIIFLCAIFTGYICGIISKFAAAVTNDSPVHYTVFFYMLNLVLVGIDICLYFRNKAIDNKKMEQKK